MDVGIGFIRPKTKIGYNVSEIYEVARPHGGVRGWYHPEI